MSFSWIIAHDCRETDGCTNFIDIDMVCEDDEFEDPKFAVCVKPKWAQSEIIFNK